MAETYIPCLYEELGSEECVGQVAQFDDDLAPLCEVHRRAELVSP